MTGRRICVNRDAYYSCVSRDILDYLRREMTGPEGEISSAEDADSVEYEGATRKKEGAFYVCTSQEVEEVLREHAGLFKDHYYIKSSGNCYLSRRSDPHNEFRAKNVLIERIDAADIALKYGVPLEKYLDILGECRKKLFDVRRKRPTMPFR